MSDELTIRIISRSEDLPQVSDKNFFHSKELFVMLEKAGGQTPYMVVAMKGDQVLAQMLATLRRRGSLIPPYLFTQGRIYGEGAYSDGTDKELLFNKMLNAITKKFQRKMCLYIEFSDLTHKMFGYKWFRQQGYFPVQWMEVHISLHSKHPEEWLTEKMRNRIARIKDHDLHFHEVGTSKEFKDFYRIIRGYFTLKVRRFLPAERLFAELNESKRARLFLTTHHDKVVGGCACVYYNNDANLWYLASKRKSHPKLHPDVATVWGAISDAYQRGCHHFYFMDVGLPFRPNPYRDFILSFGGKEVSTYRWFRFSFSWMNRFIGWFYKE